MSITGNNVVHIGQGKETLSEVPSPPKYLSSEAKRHYKNMGQKLAKLDRLKDIYLNNLEIYAEAMAQFEFASNAINKKNKENFGAGYMQVFKTGATNISTEIVLRNDAVSTLLKCFKQFGLDPLSEKGLKPGETGQMDLFEQFLNAK